MKRIIVIAALATASACSQSETAPAPEATEEAAAPVAEPVAADGKPSVGTYKVTDSDGTVLMDEVRADGTYSTTKDGEVVETGKWEQKSPETYCFTKDEEGAKQVCATETIDDKGVWTSVNPETKNVVTVERVES